MYSKRKIGVVCAMLLAHLFDLGFVLAVGVGVGL